MTNRARLLPAAILALLLGYGVAHAQGWTTHQVPLGGGWNTYSATGPFGQIMTGTEVPLGDGWTTTTWHNRTGQRATCSTVPLGGGFSTTTCR